MRVAWVHEYDPERSVASFLTTSPAASFLVDGASAAEDVVRVVTGLRLDLSERIALWGFFEGEFGDGSQSYAGVGGGDRRICRIRPRRLFRPGRHEGQVVRLAASPHRNFSAPERLLVSRAERGEIPPSSSNSFDTWLARSSDLCLERRQRHTACLRRLATHLRRHHA